MEGKLNCLRCGARMQRIKREYLQLGKTGWITGDLGNLIAGALEVTIVACPRCGKLELFTGQELMPDEEEGGMAQTICPRCGKEHDLDDPKCPFCGEANPNW